MNDAKQILVTIINDFSITKFIGFFRSKSQKFAAREESYSHFNDDNFIKGQKIGEINFTNVDSLLICSFEVTRSLSERVGKKAQYEKAKSILKSTANQRFSAGIFIFYDSSGSFRFSLVYPESIGTRRQWNNFRRFTYFVNREFTNKTFLKQIGDKEFTKLEEIKSAFSITAVTDLFYDEFFKIYKTIVDETKKINSIIDEERARDFILLFAIRTIFLGFIQRKKWLGNDEKFIQSFYQEYKDKFNGKNAFYNRWLSPLFFEALNSPPGRQVAYGNNDFSKVTEEKLQMAPYLNGGLFRQKQGYDTNGWILSDQSIETFFDFLFSHSFTIEENSLEDEDLQLNPEFLGIIFERLVNKADGAVYTPRPEVDLMCRLSLVKWLQNNLENPVKHVNLYELFFKESEKEEDQKQGSFSHKEAQEILDKLENLTICDPAVGSGAFLVGIMQILDGVEQSLRNRYGLDGKNIFERKKQIIKSSLYGVEVKEWAVWICQLRLWLSLFVEAPDELKESCEPILPSLDFKVRKGDSLVQRVGSRGVAITADKSVVSGHLLKQLRELIQLKTAHYDTGKPTIDEIEHREFLFYHDWIQQDITKEQKILIEYNKVHSANHDQQNLFGDDIVKPLVNVDLFQKEREATVEKLEYLREQLRDLHQTNKPFLWQLEFSEVFSTKGGFDIVIGNPPYVRQEDIADPTGKVKDKKEYKSYLQEMVKLDFPDYFSPKTKINAQSDLYTYFYIRALRLLNPQGIHTFICSNSWLDVGYGTWLQEFFLNRCPIEFIIDNHAKRSFESADVNTIISIIHAPQKEVDSSHIVKFLAFKKPFESAVFTENLVTIENVEEIIKNDTFRVFPILNNKLKEAGMEYDDQAQMTMKLGKYGGDKWGGKYLRAPDIFFTILEKGKDKLVTLGDIAEVRRGFTTGANQFFYISRETENRWKIEKEYLKSVIKSPQECQTIHVDPDSLKTKVLICSKPKSELVSTNILRYIDWGGNQKTKGRQKQAAGIKFSKVKTVAGRTNWYELDFKKIPDIFCNRFFNERIFFSYSENVVDDQTFYGAVLNDKSNLLVQVSVLNSTFQILFTEILGRVGLGEGVLQYAVYEMKKLLTIDPRTLTKDIRSTLQSALINLQERKINSVFVECGLNPKSDIPIERQEPKPISDRAELDKIVFEALKLSENERKDVYRAVCRLVWNRISKANSK